MKVVLRVLLCAALEIAVKHQWQEPELENLFAVVHYLQREMHVLWG